ncbi:protein containing DUF35, partial [mine drainage metagenome]
QFEGSGEVISCTTIRVPPDKFKTQAPYRIAVVRLDEGPCIEGHVVQSGRDVKIGDKVRTVFRKIYVDGDEGPIYYHYKFELI